MPESQKTKLTGQVISIEKGGYSDDVWVDLGLKLIEGHVININYRFNRESARNNITNSIKKGMAVTVTIDGLADLDRELQYRGIGSIQIHDLSNELDRFIRNEFRQKESNYFTQREVAFIERLLDKAKERIKEAFDPTDEVMVKVEEHLDSLARKSQGVTRYDWRRLFVFCVVSVSIDLGFGVTIPEVLYNLFKKLIEEFVEFRLPSPNR